MKSWITKDGRKINIRSQMGNLHRMNTIRMIMKDARIHAGLNDMHQGDSYRALYDQAERNYLESIPVFPFLLREAMRRKLIS